MRASNFGRALPRVLQGRFEGLSRYVSATLDEEDKRGGLAAADIEAIQLLVFIKALDELLKDGHEAAAKAVDELAAVGIDSVAIGSQTFSGRNEAVMRGKVLSDGLRALIGQPRLLALIDDSGSLRTLILQSAYQLRRFRGRGGER